MRDQYRGFPLRRVDRLDWETKKMIFFPDSIKDTVNAVILGYFGNGHNRRMNIERYTPYTYEEVQEEVNRTLGFKKDKSKQYN